MKKKTYVIGDVHGCYHTLLDLVSKLPKDANLIFTGDLCDKGLHTKEVIEFIKNNNYQCIFGNHEYHMISHLKNALNGDMFEWNTSDEYAGYTTVDNYKDVHTEVIDEHIAWINSLPKYIEIDRFFITHGFGLPYYNRKDDKSSTIPLRANRISSQKHKHDWESSWEDYDIINIFGHDSFQDVLAGENYFGIDTGCKYNNKLTAISLETLEIIQAKTDTRDIKSDE